MYVGGGGLCSGMCCDYNCCSAHFSAHFVPIYYVMSHVSQSTIECRLMLLLLLLLSYVDSVVLTRTSYNLCILYNCNNLSLVSIVYFLFVIGRTSFS